mmetsp:Transcript_51688/g.123037  ORF Transcript_51688/g.123037 Transcript_51688/m.123037 type:complete len:456 (-) Transcript_51688:172-1539(-)
MATQLAHAWTPLELHRQPSFRRTVLAPAPCATAMSGATVITTVGSHAQTTVTTASAPSVSSASQLGTSHTHWAVTRSIAESAPALYTGATPLKVPSSSPMVLSRSVLEPQEQMSSPKRSTVSRQVSIPLSMQSRHMHVSRSIRALPAQPQGQPLLVQSQTPHETSLTAAREDAPQQVPAVGSRSTAAIETVATSNANSTSKRHRAWTLKPISEPAPFDVPIQNSDQAEKRWDVPSGTLCVCKILCYGDSITAGYSCWDEVSGKPVEEVGSLPAFTPYGEALFKGLQAKGLPCNIVSCGLHGFTVRQMVQDSNLSMGLCMKLAEEKPDIVLLMAGTNDIWIGGIRKMLENIQAMHTKCHEAGARTVAFAPPYPDCNTWRQDAKEEVKEQLSDWVQTQQQVLSYVDPEELVSREAERHLWEPSHLPLHLTRAGYQALGERLVPLVAPLVLRLRRPSS